MVTSLFDIGFANCCKGNITVNNKLVRPEVAHLRQIVTKS